MSLATESVSLAGSGLVFVNYYDASVTDAYRGAILTAENFLQSHFTNAVTVGMQFDFAALGAGFSAQNNFSTTAVSYGRFVAALSGHATSADDFTALAGLPGFDPSGGAGFSIPTAEARILGLAAQTNSVDDTVTLNSSLGFTFGQDAVGAILHEMTEGVFGRFASLGLQGARWNPLDLFRFTAGGQRDFTGGADGQPTFFGIDGAHVTNVNFHNAISPSGANGGFDFGDWDFPAATRSAPAGPVRRGWSPPRICRFWMCWVGSRPVQASRSPRPRMTSPPASPTLPIRSAR